MTSSGDVSSSVSARGRRVLRHMTTRFSGQVDRWTTRPSGWRVDQEDDLEVRNLRQHVVDFPELIAARGGAWLTFC